MVFLLFNNLLMVLESVFVGLLVEYGGMCVIWGWRVSLYFIVGGIVEDIGMLNDDDVWII